MSKSKKVIFVVSFFVFLVVLWLVTYFCWLNVKPKSSKSITKEELESYDNSNSTFTSAKVTFNGKEYELDELNKKVLSDDVVVDVEVNGRKVQGYVTYSDKVSKPKVKLSSEEVIAKVILPDKKESDKSGKK